MIKCGDKLEGKAQCILYSKDGSKVLGRFPYSKHGGKKGAKAAAHRREGAVQFFKKKHQELVDAVSIWGAPNVLKYLLEKAADCEACQEVVESYVEKARGEGRGVGGPRQGDGGADQCVCPKCGATAAHEKGTPCNEQKCPKCGAAMTGQSAEKSEPEAEAEVEKKKKRPYGGSFSRMWKEKYGGSVRKCIKMVGDTVSDPGAYCAWLKDKALKTTKWRGKKKKSFEEIAEDALQMLQKHEEKTDDLSALLEGVDLAELEAWLASEMQAETEPAEEPAPEPTPEPEPPSEPETEPVEPEPEPEGEAEELPNDFRTFLLRDHAERQAGVMALLGEEGEEAE